MTLYFLLCKGDVLLTQEGRIPLSIPPVGLQPWNRVTAFKVGERRCEVYRLDAPPTGLEGYRMLPLRQTHALLPPDEYQLAGKCQELVYWDGNSRFCGCCGAPMQWSSPISKHCTGCGKELWPQLAVAIIVRVTRGEEILLVHAKSFRTDFYGLVAGFVETGETLEQCVEREVWEETRLRVRGIRYFGSQPWPFPCGLMVGFTAEYAEGEVHLQRSELSSGGWFKRGSLPRVPDEASIARWLIDDYLKG
ncbi:MAG: NAD(+) diphosphatase [Prevotellaceae bacterium]|nr:NAD(+) diphosphatase [Prevotellaceae bacterium]